MMWERPGAWWLLALALPIVALHLHLRRRRLVEVTSLELWRGLIPDRAGRGGMRNVRDGLALAVLLAALTAFTAAAAGPVTGTDATAPRRLAIVIDASATMNAASHSASLFNLSKGAIAYHTACFAADGAARRLAPQDELTVWAATDEPRVVHEPWAGPHGGAPSDIEPTLRPRGLATTTRLAIRAARGVSNRSATVLVLTDAVGAESLKDTASGDVDLRVGVVDETRAAQNSGIVAFDLHPSDASRVRVRVVTTDGATAPRSLVLSLDGVELTRSPVGWNADGTAADAFPLHLLATVGGLCEVRLVPGDDFAEDDAARLVLPASKPLAVAVVADRPSPFLVEALRAMPDVVDPAKTTLVAPGSSDSAFDGVDVVIADGVAAPAGKPSLTFAASGPRVVDRPLLWGVGTHAVLDGADLSPLRIERAAVLDVASGETTIVASAAGAVGVVGEQGGVRRVAFGFRPDASTLPLEAAFPLLVRNSLRWLARPTAAPRYVVAGEPMPGGDGELVPYPEPGGPYTIRTPSGAETIVRWVPPRGFRLSPEHPVTAMTAGEAVASLPDRSRDRDTRERHGPAIAAVGAALLAVGALLLKPSRARTPPPDLRRPAAISAPPEPVGASR